MAATPANTMPATLKLPIVLNIFDFEILYNISLSPYLPCGAVGCIFMVYSPSEFAAFWP
jgi:hypothetical protein